MKTLALRSVAFGVLLGGALTLGGCRDAISSALSRCDQCGTIEAITPRVEQGQTGAGGALAGAIIGGVIGHQFGSGKGNDAATVAGAAGGAIAGHEIEKNRNRYAVYDLTIRMEKGDVRHVTVASRENLHTGDKVEIVDGRVLPVSDKS
jgi:outer membrane lipoprotein SlyB